MDSFAPSYPARRRPRSRKPVQAVLAAEELELRLVPTIMRPIGIVVSSHHTLGPKFGPGQTPAGFWPAQIRHAYGFDQLSLDGTGQTIAIVDAYRAPTMAADLKVFDTQFGLLDPPSFKQVNQLGGGDASVPTAPGGDWEVEEALDVEWAHAIAPKASILLVEANSASLNDLMTAVNTARNAPGVVVVSLSWGGSEFAGQNSYDSYFTTPAGHTGVTFVAASGDSGSPASWPAVSPNVLAVGGTSLQMDAANNWTSESGWSGSGGGPSGFYSQPAYQTAYATSPYVLNTLGNTVLFNMPRGNPDVAYNADPGIGFAVYDSFPYYGSPLNWFSVGGTSAGAPQWSALLALADQGRGAAGSLDGVTQTLPGLYQLASNGTTNTNDFIDIASGDNGWPAQAGYDFVTGLGSPRANNLVHDLRNVGLATVFNITASTNSPTAGTPFGITVTAQNALGQTLTGYTGTIHFTTTDKGSGIVLPGDYTFAPGDHGSHTFAGGVTLVTAGSQSLTATDTGNAAYTGQVTVTVNAAPASVLSLSAPATASKGSPFSVTLTAKDPYGNTAAAYNGTVHFATSDLGAGVLLPGDYAFKPGDAGAHTFTAGITLVTLGTQTVTVTDKAKATLTGGTTVSVQLPQPATHFSVTIPAGLVAGSAFSITLVALDANNNTAGGYLGAVHFATSDHGPGVRLPPDYSFSAADHGIHVFTNAAVLVTAGSQTITATDKAKSSISGSAVTTVSPAAAAKLTVAGFPSPIGSGTPATFTVTAKDTYGNVATGYGGTVNFSSSDPQAQLPGSSTLTQGTGSFTAALNTVGTQSLTATDVASKSITGTQAGIRVTAALPSVQQVDPNAGVTTGGVQVNVYGTNFNGVTAVRFGTTAAQILYTSSTLLVVATPAHAAGIVDVTVVTPAGTSPTSAADQFTYFPPGQPPVPGAPIILSLTPTSGSISGGYMMTITGQNFLGTVNVAFDQTLVTPLTVSATTITVVVPPHGAGTVDVRVTAFGGTSPITPADQFTYTLNPQGGPTVTGLSPSSGSPDGGYLVAVSGTNLDLATAVYFGTTPAYIVNQGPTLLAVMVPPHAPGTLDVTVAWPLGTSPTNPADQFTYTGNAGSAGPTVQGLSPVWGPTSGGFSVTVTGTNFTGLTAVYFGTTPAQIVAASDTSIIVIAPPHPAGAVDVTVVTLAGTSPTSSYDQFLYSGGPAPAFRQGSSPYAATIQWAPLLLSYLQRGNLGAASTFINALTWDWYYITQLG
jgi:hypothetical protein